MGPQSIYRRIHLKFSENAPVGLQRSQDFPQLRSQLFTFHLSRSRLGFFSSSPAPPALHKLFACPVSGLIQLKQDAEGHWINDIYFSLYRSQTKSQLSFTLADAESGHRGGVGEKSAELILSSPSKTRKLLLRLQSPVVVSIHLFFPLCNISISSETRRHRLLIPKVPAPTILPRWHPLPGLC